MRIKGTNKADLLYGSANADTVEGGRGNDRVDGGSGNDVLIGGAGADIFVLRSGGGHDVVMDFDPAAGDRVLFDFGTYSDIMVFGRLSDGMRWSNFDQSAAFAVSAVDHDGDGVTDTMISVNDDSIVLLGWAPSALWGNCLFGG